MESEFRDAHQTPGLLAGGESGTANAGWCLSLARPKKNPAAPLSPEFATAHPHDCHGRKGLVVMGGLTEIRK